MARRRLSGEYSEINGVPVYQITPSDSGRSLTAPLLTDPAREDIVLGVIKVRRYTGTANTAAYHQRTWTSKDAASKRLITFGMIPYNALEVSKNFNDVYHGLYGNIVTVRWAEWWKLSRDPSHLGYIPVDEYFMALEKTGDLKTYIRMLALYQMTGVASKPFFVDEIYPELDHQFVYQGFPDSIKRGDGTVSIPQDEYALFWDRYWNAVLGFIDLAAHEFLGEAVDMLTLKRQYDLQSLIAQARYLQKKVQSVAPGQAANNILEYLLALPYTMKVELIGEDADGVEPDSDRESVYKSQGTFYYADRNLPSVPWQTVTKRMNDFSAKFTVKIGDQSYVATVSEMLRMLWNSQISPYISQLSDMLAQIDYIGKPDNLLTESDIASIKNYDQNLFLKFAVEQSTATGVPTFEQTAQAPILQRYATQLQFVPLPELSYMQQSFLNIPQTAAKFVPVYSVETQPTLPQPVKKSNLLTWLLVGGAAAGAYYLSQR